MRKTLTLGVLVFTLMTVARPAEAHIWDFLQEWSGPGPFTGYPMVMGSICKPTYSAPIPNSDDNAESCVFFDYRDLETAENENFPIAVRVRFWDLGVKQKLRVWKLQESIEAGLAVGLMLASGDKDAGGKNAVRFTVTAPRLVLMPALLVNELVGNKITGKHKAWLRIFKAHLGGTFIVGQLDAEALGVDRTLSDYSRNWEYVLSRGVVIDLGELIPLFHN